MDLPTPFIRPHVITISLRQSYCCWKRTGNVFDISLTFPFFSGKKKSFLQFWWNARVFKKKKKNIRQKEKAVHQRITTEHTTSCCSFSLCVKRDSMISWALENDLSWKIQRHNKKWNNTTTNGDKKRRGQRKKRRFYFLNNFTMRLLH